MSSGLHWKKAVKIMYKEECNNIFVFVGLPRINQEEVETLNGVLKVVLLARSCS